MTIKTDLQALTESGYIPHVQPNAVTNPQVHRYVLENIDSEEAVEAAVHAINALLESNPHLAFISRPTLQETLEEKIRTCPHLIINKNAVCLSDQTKAPSDLDIQCRDVFFSEAIIKEPIQCERGHMFEKKHIEGWLKERGNVCPYGKPVHTVGSIEEDDLYLKEAIRSKVEVYETQARINTETREHTERDRRIQNVRINALQQTLRKPGRTVELGSAVGKVIGKSGGAIAKEAACVGGECALHAFAKKIPFISIGVGVALGLYRAYRESVERDTAQYVKAFTEVVSGIAACAPVYGTAVSIGLDAVMGAHDIYEINSGKTFMNIDVETAHGFLGLDSNNQPTQEEINSAFRSISTIVHPDHNADHNMIGAASQKELQAIQTAIQESKNLLYDHYGYSN